MVAVRRRAKMPGRCDRRWIAALLRRATAVACLSILPACVRLARELHVVPDPARDIIEPRGRIELNLHDRTATTPRTATCLRVREFYSNVIDTCTLQCRHYTHNGQRLLCDPQYRSHLSSSSGCICFPAYFSRSVCYITRNRASVLYGGRSDQSPIFCKDPTISGLLQKLTTDRKI